MGLFFLLSTRSPGVPERDLPPEMLERQVAECVRTRCPDVTWLANFRLPGQAGCLDVVEAPYGDAALRLAVLIRSRGHTRVELHAAAEHPARHREATTRHPAPAFAPAQPAML